MKKLFIPVLFLSFVYAQNEKTFTLNPDNTVLRWTAEKVTGTHWGYVKVEGGSVVVKGKKILTGECIVDMSTITVMDMKDSPYGIKLENHLRSTDFFDTENHSRASLKIKSVSYKQGSVDLTGDLTIKGISHPVEFPATLGFSDKGASAKGQIKIDRTLYDIKYRSGKYFPDIGDKMIYDVFKIDFEVKAE